MSLILWRSFWGQKTYIRAKRLKKTWEGLKVLDSKTTFAIVFYRTGQKIIIIIRWDFECWFKPGFLGKSFNLNQFIIKEIFKTIKNLVNNIRNFQVLDLFLNFFIFSENSIQFIKILVNIFQRIPEK